MRDLAYIAKIDNLAPILEKDRIELATVAGWNVIVEKGKYFVGELVVYCEYDTILPANNPHFEFLRKRCYSSLYNGFRIQNMKMAGVFSQGIVFPLSILPPENKKGSVYKEGLSVTDILGIQKYDPEAKIELNSVKKNSKFLKFFLKNKYFRQIWKKLNTKPKGEYPETVKKSDEINIQKIFEEFKENYNTEKFYVSEKIEGQASTFLLQKNKYRFFSHNIEVTKAGNTNWERISKNENLEKKLRAYKKKHKIELAIQGEIVGPGIQKNIYGLGGLQLFVYKITDVKTGKAFNFYKMAEIAREMLLPIVPVLTTKKTLEEFSSVDEILAYSNGESILRKGVKREGVVFRSMENQSIGFKVKSPEYLMWFSKSDKTL